MAYHVYGIDLAEELNDAAEDEDDEMPPDPEEHLQQMMDARNSLLAYLHQRLEQAREQGFETDAIALEEMLNQYGQL